MTELHDAMTRLLRGRIGFVPERWPIRAVRLIGEWARVDESTPLLVLRQLQEGRRPDRFEELVALSTISATSFFRHAEHFDALRVFFRKRSIGRLRPFRVWSAGCATGQEAFSVAICAQEVGVDVEIVGTDVSPAEVRFASEGRYDAVAARGIPGHSSKRGWTAPKALRDRVRFVVESLMDPRPGAGGGPFDVIFLRNVLVYFDEAGTQHIAHAVRKNLAPDGVLVLAPAEAVLRPLTGFVKRDPIGWLTRPPPAPRPRETLPPPKHVASTKPPPALDLPLDRAARALSQCEFDQAEAILRAQLDANGNDVQAWFLLGETLEQRGERAQARTAFRCAARIGASGSVFERNTLAPAATRRANALEPGSTD